MAQLQLADRVRAYALNEIVAPGLRQAPTVAVRAGDVHAALGLRDRAGAVCRALWAQRFQDRNGLRLIATEGPPEGLNTTFVFVDALAASARGHGPELTPTHAETLAWFAAAAGQIRAWRDLQATEPFKAIAPKGIYRPAQWRHALSVKAIPTGPYPDELPAVATPGTVFRYHQEEPKRADPAVERSNLGLANCMRDGVPVGIVRQVRAGPGALYEVVGVGRVLGWEGGYFSIEILDQLATGAPSAPATPVEGAPPISDEDARRRVWRAIVARRGQAKFRQALLDAYGGRCAISGCEVQDVLEAAHIVRYLGDHTDVVTNGLLLRSDLHTLFDLGLLRIEPETRRVVLDVTLRGSEYGVLHDRALRNPTSVGQRPAVDLLQRAWTSALGIGDGAM